MKQKSTEKNLGTSLPSNINCDGVSGCAVWSMSAILWQIHPNKDLGKFTAFLKLEFMTTAS